MATRDFSQMEEVMNRRATQVNARIDRAVSLLATQVGKAVVEATPVDTGKARSNYIANLNRRFASVIPPRFPGKKLGRGETANAIAAINQIRREVLSFKSIQKNVLFIVNNTPYLVPYLNIAGRSPQARPGFLQRAVASARTTLRNYKLLPR